MNRKPTVVLLVAANLCVFLACLGVFLSNLKLTDQIPPLQVAVDEAQAKYRVVAVSNRLTDTRHKELVKEANAAIHAMAWAMYEKNTLQGPTSMLPFIESDVDKEYWRLFARLHLSVTNADKLRRLIALSKIQSTLTPAVPSEIARIAQVQFPIVINAASYANDIKLLLGESSYQEYVEYTARLPAMKEADAMANYVNTVSSTLSASQIDNLTDVSLQITPLKYPPLTAPADERNRFFELVDQRNNELLEKSRPFLNAQQLTALTHYLQTIGDAARARYQLYGH